MENLFTGIIKDKTINEDKAFCGISNVTVQDCDFLGGGAAEFSLKNSQRINIHSCFFDLPYPLWNSQRFTVDGCRFTDKAREAFWFACFGTITNSDILCKMSFRECHDIRLRGSLIDSDEFGWECNRFIIENVNISSGYLLMNSKDIQMNHITMKGQFAFRHTENVTIENSHLNSNEAFWHGKNITIRNSVIEGEKICWFSDGVIMENCTIIGEEPFHFCKNVKLINCKLENAKAAFEESEVEASIFGKVDSIINPIKGHITLDAIGEVVYTEDMKDRCKCEIITRE